MGRRKYHEGEYVNPVVQSAIRHAEQAGGTALVIQNGHTGQWWWWSPTPDRCLQKEYSDSGKPEKLQQLGVSDDALQTFDAKVSATVAAMKDERYPMYMLPLVVGFMMLGFAMNVSTFAARGSDTDDTDARGSDTDTDNTTVSPAFVLPLLGFAAYFAVKTWVVKHNQVADKELRSAGQRLASETGLHAEYRSENTGVCKSRGSQIFRGFVIFPGAVIGAAQAAEPATVMALPVPAGVGPGTTLQVTAPSGQTLQVVVPPGLGPGQVFQVQLPPVQPVMVAAAVVVAQPVVDAQVVNAQMV
mmetsp:Transcript_39893/g.118308  ORF Transcript_39893/g.118308 Transcript_39893/m.118308 type:complete len:301 (+) Transcript_39893:93-995(+)